MMALLIYFSFILHLLALNNLPLSGISSPLPFLFDFHRARDHSWNYSWNLIGITQPPSC